MKKLGVYGQKSRQFLREVWVEVKHPDGKVTYPNREEVKSATIVIILALFAIGFLYIGVLDWLIAMVMDWILPG